MGNGLRRALRDNSIQTKLLAAVSALIFAAGILIICLGHVRFTYDYQEQAADDMQQLIDQVALNIDTYLDELARLCLSPYYSSEVMELLEVEPATGQELLDKRRDIEGYLRQVMITPRKDILRVYIFSDSVYSCARTGRSGIPGDYAGEAWYAESLKTDDYVYLPADTENFGSSSYMVFSVAKRLQSLSDNSRTVGVIRVDANYNGIKAVCDRVTVGTDAALLILDEAGNLIYSNSNLPEGISTSEIQRAAPASGYLAGKLGGGSYIFNSQSVSTTGWSVVSVNSRAEVTKGAKTTLLFNMALAIALAGAGVLVSACYVKKLLRPLYQTVGLMEEVQAGDLDVRAPEGGTDEIAYLNTAFNRMLEQIQAMLVQEGLLTKQVYEAKYLQKQAQFDALYHQIQPHFLFNTLNTISLLVKCGRDAEAVSGIDQLATLLRGMANAGREISLSDELRITESYLHLQKLRHDDLSYNIEVSGAAPDYRLLALTIQPLVENALIHGCEARSGAISIDIAVRAGGGALSVSVSDNGVGMDAATLARVRERLEHCDDSELVEAGSGGIGLINIQRRIRLAFGAGWGLAIDSRPGSGTAVTLTLPWRE